MALEESYLTSSIPKRIIVSECHFLKEIDQFLWRTTGEVTTNTYLKSCGYLSAALSFMGILAILNTLTRQCYTSISCVTC